jgi:hypothetical protein
MSESGINIQAFAIKSRPDILFFKANPLAGTRTHENAGKSETLEKKKGSRNVRNIPTCEHVFKRWGRSGVDLGSYEIILEVRRCVF